MDVIKMLLIVYRGIAGNARGVWDWRYGPGLQKGEKEEGSIMNDELNLEPRGKQMSKLESSMRSLRINDI